MKCYKFPFGHAAEIKGPKGHMYRNEQQTAGESNCYSHGEK